MRSLNAIALSCGLLAVPFTACVADDELTQELHGNSYQESTPASATCGTNYCNLIFAPTQHVTTVITNVNCSFTMTQGSQVAYATLYTKNLTAVANVPVTILGNDLSGTTYLVINQTVNYFIKQNQSPAVYVNLVVGSLQGPVQCLISGYHS